MNKPRYRWSYEHRKWFWNRTQFFAFHELPLKLPRWIR